jgi:signal peptidase I
VLPAAASLLLARHLLPTPVAVPAGSILGAVARFGDAHALGLTVGLFLATSALARYWRSHLPGARFLSPPERPMASSAAAPLRRTLSFAALVVSAALAASLLRASAAESFQVTSGSMLPTLAPGDRILASKLAYRGQGTPRRGDVVVFRRTEGMTEAGPEELVKRVVGLPGDRIEIRQGRLFINDWAVPRCDAGVYPHLVGAETTLGRLTVEFLADRVFLTPFSRPFPPYRVAPDEVFVLGDNRNDSADSRIWKKGRGAGVPLAAIEGRAARLLAARDRDGRIDLGTLFRPLGLAVHLPGMDVRPLEEGIRKCLQAAPPSTWPPPS